MNTFEAIKDMLDNQGNALAKWKAEVARLRKERDFAHDVIRERNKAITKLKREIKRLTPGDEKQAFKHTDYTVACGGHEKPMSYNNKTYLYVWNTKQKRHEYYVYEDDAFIADTDAPWL